MLFGPCLVGPAGSKSISSASGHSAGMGTKVTFKKSRQLESKSKLDPESVFAKRTGHFYFCFSRSEKSTQFLHVFPASHHTTAPQPSIRGSKATTFEQPWGKATHRIDCNQMFPHAAVTFRDRFLTNQPCIASCSDKEFFLNDLAAKMAAGPPQKPVGLVKKPALDAEAAGASVVPSAAERKLSELLKATARETKMGEAPAKKE